MKTILLALGLMLAGGTVGGGEAVLFSATKASFDAWQWEGAKLKADEKGGLVLTPDRANLPSVVLQDRFAWCPDGVVRLDVRQAVAGTFSLQVLAFKGPTYLGALDLVKASDQKGVMVFPFDRLAFPPGTETVTFKLWVSRGIGTAISINELEYVIPINPEQVVYEGKMDAATRVEADQLDWTLGDAGAQVRLRDGSSIGSLLFTDQIPRQDSRHLIVQLNDVKGGSVAAQVCAFNEAGEYLDSVDVVKHATAGISCALGGIAWPEGTATFQVKLWAGGDSGMSALIQRLLVLK